MCAGRGISVESRRTVDTKNAVLTSDIKHEELKKDFPVTNKATSSQRLNNLLFSLLFCLIVKCFKGLNRTDDFDISVSLPVQLRTLTWSLVKCFMTPPAFRQEKSGNKNSVVKACFQEALAEFPCSLRADRSKASGGPPHCGCWGIKSQTAYIQSTCLSLFRLLQRTGDVDNTSPVAAGGIQMCELHHSHKPVALR